MSMERADYLKNQVKVMGHGEQHFAAIEENVKMGVKQFESKGEHEFYKGNRKLSTTLHFNQGNRNELYFWNGYTATLKTPQGEEISQRFYIDVIRWDNEVTGKKESRTVGFTPKEACNLLDKDHLGNSRAVYKEYYNKEGEAYMGWKKLDLKSVDDKGNHKIISFKDFNLEKVLAHYDIIEKMDEVLQSLKKGNLQAVTVVEDGERVRRYFAADPANMDILVYDSSLRLIQQNKLEVKTVDVIPEKKTAPEQEKNIPESSTTSVSKDVTGVKEKEQLLSNGTTNQSQEVKDKGQSKDKDHDLGDKPLMEKEAKKRNNNKKVKGEDAPPKNAPSRGKGSEGELMGKNRNSSKNKGVGI